MLALVGALILGGAIFYLALTIQQAAETSEAENRLNFDNFTNDEKTNPLPGYIKLCKPLLKGNFIKIALGFWAPNQAEKWRKRIVAAGLNKLIEAEHLLAAKFWLPIAAGFFLFLNQAFASEPLPPFFAIAVPALLFFWPDLDLSQRQTTRHTEIRLSMPYVVDLLTLSTEAGLDFMGAIGKVVDRAPPSPLIDELALVLKDIQLGKTRAEALRSMADRVDMPEMSSFIATLVSSDQMGASIGIVLRAQSDTMRTERLVRAEKLAAQASQKMLLPLVFFIMPAVMLMIFGPLILGFITGANS